MIEAGKIRPAMFEKEYIGLESIKEAMKDLGERKVWGKAVVKIGEQAGGGIKTKTDAKL